MGTVGKPQDLAAAYFMERKGYPEAKPRDVVKLDGHLCWYYVYDLEDGVLELEVEWVEEPEPGWSTRVTTFATP
jgi:hypothetical protein